MKIGISKLVGDLGEQWSVEFPVSSDVLKAKDPVNAIKAAIAPVLRVVDDRLLEMNMRLINHNKAAQGLTPEGLLAVRQCVEVMYGRRVAPDGEQGKGVQEQTLSGTSAERPTASSVTQAKADKAADVLADALSAIDSGR